MHPAFSVILLTTLIGVGQGLFLALYTGQVYALAHLVPTPGGQGFYGLGSLLALAFLAGGLLASFFHLGHPERGWRAITRWRTSWLSREVILLPAFMLVVALYGSVHYVGWTRPLVVVAGALPVDATLVLGLVGSVLAFLLFVATGMIYACLKFLQEWHHPLTVFNYTLLGLASGFTLAAAFSAYTGAGLLTLYGVWAVVFTAAGFVTRLWSLTRNRRLRHKSSLQTAIGLRHTRIRQKAQGAMGGSFNTREFFHGRGPAVVQGIRVAFLVLVFPLPVLILGAAYLTQSPTLPLAAFLCQYLGLLAERWYFFAEARHPQNLYYRYIS